MKNELKNNRLLTRQLKMAQLEAVSAGAEDEAEEPNEVVIGMLIIIGAQLLITVFSFLMALGIAGIIMWVRKHEVAIIAAILALGYKKEAAAYKNLSAADKDRVWREAYAKAKH